MTRLFSVLTMLVLVVGCSSSSPTQPSGANSTGAPTPLQPAAGAKISFASQPVTLVVSNGMATGTNPITYSFEVATDSGFGAKVFIKDGVAQGGNGQTSLTINSLAGSTDYYWHARVVSGTTTGVFGPTAKFTVASAVILSPPVPVSPLTGANVYTRPPLTVANAARQGPAGAITYKFEISLNAGFTSVVVSATVPEGDGGQTSFTPTTDLPNLTTIYWRVTALDAANSASSAPSAVQAVKTTMALDLHTVTYARGPNVADWPQTATIIAVEQDGNAANNGPMCISFSTSDYWPSVGFFGDPTVPVYANQWYIANINGQWYAGAGEWLRSDRGWCKSGQATNNIGPDGGWAPPMDTWVPHPGDMVGYMVTTPARDWPDMSTTNERSNVVVQPWYDSSMQSSTVSSTVRRTIKR